MNYLYQLLIIIILVLLGSGKVTIQGRASRRYVRNSKDSVLFNAFLFAAIALFLALFFPKSPLSAGILVFGCAVAVGTMIFQVGYAISLSTGPVSISVMIMNFSVMISTLFSLFYFKEQLFITQIAGMLFLVMSMVLSADTSADKSGGVTGKWLFVSIAAMLANGTASCILKLFSSTSYAETENSDITMLIVTYAVASALSFALFVLKGHTGKREKLSFKLGFGLPLYALATGAVLSVYQKLNMYALATIDGSFMFPTYAGLSSLCMTFIGIVFFGDRLSKRQKLSVVCGIACVLLMNIRLGFSFKIG